MVDIQDAEGSIKSLPPQRKEEGAGQLMTVDVVPTVDLFIKPTQFDQFFDNVNAGATPSAFLWRTQGDQTYLRWFQFKKIAIELPRKVEHMLKLVTQKLEEETDADYKKSRIEVVLLCYPQKCDAEISSTHARLSLKVKGHVSPADHMKLIELFRREKLTISFYQRQADLVQAPADEPRAPAPVSTDKLYGAAAEAVCEIDAHSRVAPAYLQKALKVGFNRAALLLEAMEKAGVVGPLDKDGTREVLTPGETGRNGDGEGTPSPEPEAPAVDLAAKAPPKGGRKRGAPPGQNTPKSAHDWDEEAGQWIDHAGKRVEPQPAPPEFVNVNKLPDADKGAGLE